MRTAYGVCLLPYFPGKGEISDSAIKSILLKKFSDIPHNRPLLSYGSHSTI